MVSQKHAVSIKRHSGLKCFNEVSVDPCDLHAVALLLSISSVRYCPIKKLLYNFIFLLFTVYIELGADIYVAT